MVDAWERLADYLALFPLILPAAGAFARAGILHTEDEMVILGRNDRGRLPGMRYHAPLLGGYARPRCSLAA